MWGKDTGRDVRGVSPVVGSILMVSVIVLLAAVVGTLTLGIAQDETPQDAQEVLVDDQCPGFQVVEFDPTNVGAAAEQLTTENCALWLEQGNVETTDSGEVTRWNDAGKNNFDAVQTAAGDRPELVQDSELDKKVLDFSSSHAPNPSSEGDNDGHYLELNRDISDLDVDEDTGIVVAAVIKAEQFDRGGSWTIGKAGVSGREFSMRACSDRSRDGCQASDPEGKWRGQNWGSADVDFSSGDDSAGEWLTLVQTYDGDEATIRINGEQVAQKDVDLDLSDDRDIQIGRWERVPGDPRWYFDGRIAELVIVDEALDEGEIELIETYFNQEHGVALDGPIDS
jgi:FlaG/FlaF family flagellin (archaellin)